ncbi:hypothetical protein EHM69_05180 [candidate division KSB1 bacterium]|nr:MAG: hypothetical protein EHM69_05180 [candidate division KSB1 bacterium]
MRTATILVYLFVLSTILSAQPVLTDSVSVPAPKPADTIWVIPAGPIAGTFTPASRITVNDTIAGWARILVEGWVPVSAVISRMSAATPAENPALTGEENKSTARVQCAAITTKGVRCKRMAEPGSKYCWQHQSRK